MKTIELVELLTGAKKSGADRWQAKCPAHEDKQASLSISTTQDGKTLLHCHAGCEAIDIVTAMGLSMQDLFPERPYDAAAAARHKPKAPKASSKSVASAKQRLGKIVAIYDYVDADGQLIYQAVRYDPKDFRLRRPDGKGGWIGSLDGIDRIVYKLPQCLATIKARKPTYIVGGEKDCETLGLWELTATTNAGGEGKWEPAMSESLAGADLVIVPDNDAQGWHHASCVAAYSAQFAHSIRILELPGLKLKGDTTNWVEAGGSRAEFLALARSAVDILPELLAESSDLEMAVLNELDKNSANALLEFHQTDLGNAQAFVAAHGKNIHYCRGLNKDQFLIWADNRWIVDERGQVQRWACETVRGGYAYMAELEHSSRNEMFKHLKRSEKADRLNAMINLARHVDKDVPVISTDLDADPWLFNVGNGTIDLRTGELQPHNRKDLITKLAGVDYDATAECRRWMQFLAEVFENDFELITYIQRMVGYCLTGSVREQMLFILIGKGANGKSVMLETLRKLIGDYGSDTAVTTFTERATDASTVGLASLYGARMVSAAEGSGEQVWDEALLKKLTGGDPITARHLYCPFITYLPQFKLLVSSNESPRLRGQGYAIKRRVRLIPFNVRFHDPQEDLLPLRDPNLLSKLEDELPGILNWALSGCLDWQKHGLGMPQAVKLNTDKLFSDQDPLLEWLDNRCEMMPGAETTTGELWKDYKDWCANQGRETSFRTSQYFSRNLAQRDGLDTRRTGKARFLTGLQLKPYDELEVPHISQEDEYDGLFGGDE